MSNGGAHIQLAAIGKQDEYLTSQPGITFFKCSHPRHTIFSYHTSTQGFSQNGNGPNSRMVAEVSRSGDLLCNAMLRVELPAVAGTCYRNGIGNYIVNRVRLEIGSNKIDEIYGSYMDILEELTSKEGNRQGMMTGYGSIGEREAAAAGKQVLYIPLPFYFFQEHCNAIPLVALQYHKVNIVADLKEMSADWFEGQNVPEGGLPSNASVKCDMFFEYVLLGDEERSKFAKSDIEMLVRQTQFVKKMQTVSANDNIVIDTHFNHPVSSLYWIAEKSDKSLHEMGTASLMLNNQQRLDHNNGSEVDCSFFNVVEPYRRHSRQPRKGIYTYSFCAHPERISPSGSLNFSRIDNPRLTLKAPAQLDDGADTQSLEVTVYANNWNVLNIKGGLAGIKWAN